MAKKNDRKSNLQSKDVVKQRPVSSGRSDKIEVEGKVVDVLMRRLHCRTSKWLYCRGLRFW